MTRDSVDVQQRLAGLQQELQLARQALEDFTYSVSHDLRAPLRHIGAYLKIIREDMGAGMDPAINAHLQTVSDAALLLGRQMDGLLELSRLGQSDLCLSDVDLSRLIAQVGEQVTSAFPDRPLLWRVAPGLPVVRCDMALLGQMLIHLLGNAVKFSATAGSPCVSVDWSSAGEGFCRLTISDNGVGFDSRFQDRLFRVFQRLHSNRQSPGFGDGLGIGLAFARQVVERHGGGIQIRGDLNPGCEVSLTLPLAGEGKH